ncbi:HNH endonuclease [Stieleria maiorica]|nr:HNH endonuclease [Stieleria maiorica]
MTIPHVDIGHSSPDKRFYRASPATYGLIEWLETGNELKGNSDRSSELDDDVSEILGGEQTPTEKEQLVLARVGQGQFRSGVLLLWSNRCAVTGTRFAVRASHIKPWRDCSDAERLDPNNGLPLVATLDALFDSHLISFNTNGEIMLSNSLPEHEQTALGIATDMRLLTKPTLETERYLQMHREFLLT